MFDDNGGGRVARWLGITALVALPILGGCEQLEGERGEQQQAGEGRTEQLQEEAQQATQEQQELLEQQQELRGEAQEARQEQEQLAQREQQLEGRLEQTEQELQQERQRAQQLGQRTEQVEQQREQQLAQEQQRQQTQQEQQDVQQQQQLAQREQQQAQQEQQRMQQEQRPQQQAQQGQQAGAAGGAAAGAIAGRQQGQAIQQPAIEGQVRGTVQQVDLAQGTLVIDAQGQRVRLRAQPSDIAEINQGDSVTLPFASFGDAQWVISEGGGQEMTQMFQDTQRMQGVVSNVDKNNGTITIEGQELSGHPQQLAQVMPGQQVSVQIAQVENRPWIAELQTSGATAQAGQQQQGEQPAQG